MYHPPDFSWLLAWPPNQAEQQWTGLDEKEGTLFWQVG